ncbi:hypothetical protein LRY65_02165 [Candidatus Woesebacteria bacterium]|nr:hypothetical protein [Candidatus Woesebacteria bacterium]MCD8507315.1 hypothetical protein [Candidatus Woesebacteria bacterium]MCD8526997.1 hypothetical protein [Candidatus Woesebacteria bacterium]MCD8546763.1 hypothetical protein [Candidatus Woesebacteria bacterium]
MSDTRVRTTIRLPKTLKNNVQQQALQMNISFQKLVETALQSYLSQKHQQNASQIITHAKDIGTPLDSLTREDIYAD